MRSYKSSYLRTLPVLAAILIAMSLGATASAESSSSGAPEVGDPYQKSIDRAWQEAVDGKNPSAACAGLKGRVMGTKDTTAFRALFACNVDIPVRYFETYLDRVETGDHTCMDFMTHFITQISAMTMSTDSLQKMADSLAATGDAESAVQDALGSAADEAMTETGLEDPKRLIKKRLTERTQAVCPDIAGVVLR